MQLKFNRTSASVPAVLTPIDEQPDYRSKLDALERLNSQLRAVQAEKDKLLALQNGASKSRTSGLDALAQSYLDGGPADFYTRTREERFTTLNRQYRSLYGAIEVTERDLRALRVHLSVKTAAEQKKLFIAHARLTLQGMLLMQIGNGGIEALCQQRKDLGYTETFHPVGIPWPQWGGIKEENSVWSMMLREFLEMEVITAVEHHRITQGFMQFEP